eukprot:jgi/Botrbrau1/18607/Bobra.0367s0047.1
MAKSKYGQHKVIVLSQPVPAITHAEQLQRACTNVTADLMGRCQQLTMNHGQSHGSLWRVLRAHDHQYSAHFSEVPVWNANTGPVVALNGSFAPELYRAWHSDAEWRTGGLLRSWRGGDERPNSLRSSACFVEVPRLVSTVNLMRRQAPSPWGAQNMAVPQEAPLKGGGSPLDRPPPGWNQVTPTEDAGPLEGGAGAVEMREAQAQTDSFREASERRSGPRRPTATSPADPPGPHTSWFPPGINWLDKKAAQDARGPQNPSTKGTLSSRYPGIHVPIVGTGPLGPPRRTAPDAQPASAPLRPLPSKKASGGRETQTNAQGPASFGNAALLPDQARRPMGPAAVILAEQPPTLPEQADHPAPAVGEPSATQTAASLPNQATNAFVVIRSPRGGHVAPQLPDQDGKPLVFYTGEWPAAPRVPSGTASFSNPRTATQGVIDLSGPPQQASCHALPVRGAAPGPQRAGTEVMTSSTLPSVCPSGDAAADKARASGAAERAWGPGQCPSLLRETVPHARDTVLQSRDAAPQPSQGPSAPCLGASGTRKGPGDRPETASRLGRDKKTGKGVGSTPWGTGVEQLRPRQRNKQDPEGAALPPVPELATNDSLAELERLIRRQHQQLVARGILGKETLTPLEALGMDASTGNASTLDDLEAGLVRLGHLADDLASTWTRTSEHSTRSQDAKSGAPTNAQAAGNSSSNLAWHDTHPVPHGTQPAVHGTHPADFFRHMDDMPQRTEPTGSRAGQSPLPPSWHDAPLRGDVTIPSGRVPTGDGAAPSWVPQCTAGAGSGWQGTGRVELGPPQGTGTACTAGGMPWDVPEDSDGTSSLSGLSLSQLDVNLRHPGSRGSSPATSCTSGRLSSGDVTLCHPGSQRDRAAAPVPLCTASHESRPAGRDRREELKSGLEGRRMRHGTARTAWQDGMPELGRCTSSSSGSASELSTDEGSSSDAGSHRKSGPRWRSARSSVRSFSFVQPRA